MKRKIALVTTGLEYGGGVPSIVKFLYETIQKSENFSVQIIDLATSKNDANSVRLFGPNTWLSDIHEVHDCWNHIPVTKFGAYIPEIEFFRYLPRKKLTNYLEEYDLIHIVVGAPPMAFAAKLASKPLCLFVATNSYQDRKSRISRQALPQKIYSHLMVIINTLLERRALKNVDYVFAESDYTYNLFKPFFDTSKMNVAIPGVDIDFFHPPPKYNQDGPILFVGRLNDPRKNIRMLFEAYSIAQKLCDELPKLILAGFNEPSDSDLDVAKSAGIFSKMEIHSNVSKEVLADLYRRSSMFLLPSIEEGLGVVVLEAMASGLPVISTKCGGPESIIIQGQTGYLVQNDHPVEMAERIVELYNNPELRESLGHKASSTARREYSLQASGERYLQVYERLIGPNNQDKRDKRGI